MCIVVNFPLDGQETFCEKKCRGRVKVVNGNVNKALGGEGMLLAVDSLDWAEQSVWCLIQQLLEGVYSEGICHVILYRRYRLNDKNILK